MARGQWHADEESIWACACAGNKPSGYVTSFSQKRRTFCIVVKLMKLMKLAETKTVLVGVGLLAAIGMSQLSRSQDSSPGADSATTQPAAPTTRPGDRLVAVTFDGGHDTVGADRGRPVVLVAAALEVPDEVFRDAFTHVHPAGNGGPTDAEARQNKEALLSRLAPYGVTNDRLDEVSNYYRYRRSSGQLWTHREAQARAIVRDGTVIGFDLLDAGAGYSSPPSVSVEGYADVAVTVKLAFGKDLKTNGEIKTFTIAPAGR
jgi:hypothetical protein